MPSFYPPLDLAVRTPRLVLAGATDELLHGLMPVVRAGVVDTDAAPFDDPMSLYADSPEREWRADFTLFGSVTTFSWIAPAVRRRGLGREMRSAILHLAFAGLAAREATSEAFPDNDASNGVSRSLGYEPNGTNWATRRGNPAIMRRWRLTRERWEHTRRDDLQIAGLEACKPVLGL